MLLPKFVGIGAPRCGTRWLHQCLSEHPQIALLAGEAYFFTTRRVVHSRWSKGLEWYSGLFEKCVGPGVTTWGEITPVYLFDDDTPGLMHECIPEAKLICCLRDQSERAYSWYRLFLHFNPDIFSTDYSFRQFLTYQNDVYGREGFYLEHLQRYLALYPRESMIVLLYDDLEKDPVGCIQRVYRFLEADSSFVPPSVNKRINPMNLEIPRSKTLERFSARIRKARKLKRMKLSRLGHVIDRLNSVQVAPADFPVRHKMGPEMRARMAELYRDHNKKLGEFLRRDLTRWNCGNWELKRDPRIFG